jgi:hypothetical protein
MGDFCTGAEKFRKRPDKGDNPVMAWRFIKLKQPTEEEPEGPTNPKQRELEEYGEDDPEHSDDDPRAGEE